MRILPNEFDQADVRAATVAATPMPKIGWGVFLSILPVLLIYWMLMGLFMTGQVVIKIVK